MSCCVEKKFKPGLGGFIAAAIDQIIPETAKSTANLRIADTPPLPYSNITCPFCRSVNQLRYNFDMLKATEKIWYNGKFITWDEAKIHVLSHVVSYGSSVFEGARCYETKQGPAIFRAPEHARRLLDSAKIYRMTIPFTVEQLTAAMVDTVRLNNLRSCYIRPIALRGYGDVGVLPKANPVETYIAVWEWGKYLGEEALAQGVDVCISSWTRIAPNTLPALAKAGANYMNSQLIRMEAAKNGYAEGIALDTNGY